MKRILFYLLYAFCVFKPYSNSDAVGGWAGWYELAGKTIAFESIEGKRFFAF